MTNMEGMFNGATSFNRDISEWDVSAVRTMTGMFKGARSFAQALRGAIWTALKASTKVDMTEMFVGSNSNIGGLYYPPARWHQLCTWRWWP